MQGRIIYPWNWTGEFEAFLSSTGRHVRAICRLLLMFLRLGANKLSYKSTLSSSSWITKDEQQHAVELAYFIKFVPK